MDPTEPVAQSVPVCGRVLGASSSPRRMSQLKGDDPAVREDAPHLRLVQPILGAVLIPLLVVVGTVIASV